jgi:glycosyltransferase involved in cell wall biosynthesis
MTTPLVTVITSTFRRPNLLLDRCIPSVQAQTYPQVEHVVVSDEPAPGLAEAIRARFPGVIYDELPYWVPVSNSGVRPRLRGLELAHGDLIAYLDDDDAFRPSHCELLATALAQNPESGFAYSRMASHGAAMEPAGGAVVGSDTLGPCMVGTPMIMHRKELTELGSWGPPDSMEDWRLVARWLQRQVKAQFIPQVTVDAFPSTYRATMDAPA